MNLKQFVLNTLRRASCRWPGRYNALKKAHVGRNQYICSLCGPNKTYPKKSIQVDHIEPVVPVTGFTNLDDFVARLFVDEDGYQVLCKPCHKEKTKKENKKRNQKAGLKCQENEGLE